MDALQRRRAGKRAFADYAQAGRQGHAFDRFAPEGVDDRFDALGHDDVLVLAVVVDEYAVAQNDELVQQPVPVQRFLERVAARCASRSAAG